ncbi:hypothetical protein U0070_017988 [Myodes glareolus]|uniref:2'-5'-oligoadenylate synthetase 1 domain-containing protein n=1 Tax=Myodes glareolus TaxID=447135 RepID=A0AAW0HWC2_MYOGA
MGQGLSNTPASELSKFIEDQLLPDTSFRNDVRAVIDVMCTFLKERFFQGATHPMRVSKVVKPVSLFPLDRPKNPREGLGCYLSEASFIGHVSVYCKPDPEIYRRLIRKCTFLGKEGEFSTYFTELQRNFLKHRPPKLKRLICLVKHWYQLCKEKLGKPLPPQYALELLTVYAWERGSGVTEFNTAEGFRTILELVTKYREL